MPLYLAENLKYLRENERLTQQAFADIIGIKKNTFGNYETGYSTPDYLVLRKICHHFKISADDLLYVRLQDKVTALSTGAAGETLPYLNESYVAYNAVEGNVFLLNDLASVNLAMLLSQPSRLKQMPRLYLPYLDKGIFVSVTMAGDNMQPTIKKGNNIIARQQQPGANGIKDGNIYLLSDTQNRLLCHRVHKASKLQYALHSDNDLYKPYTVPLASITTILEVVEVHSSDFSNSYAQLKNEITKIWEKISELSVKPAGNKK